MDNFTDALNINDSDKSQDAMPDKVPGTEAPDGSALALKGVGQFHITMGWILGIVFLALGILCCTSDLLIIFGIVFIIVAIVSIITGYMKGAKAKATAVAAINAKKAAERSARMEQMMMNMVGGNGQVVAAPSVVQISCPKCGTKIPATTKFCPECGSPTTATCAKCGTSLVAGSKFCPECGTPAK